MRQQDFARLGQSKATPFFAKEGLSHLLLELAHLQADGRGRAAELGGCLGEAAEIVADDKGAQYVNLQVALRHLLRLPWTAGLRPVLFREGRSRSEGLWQS